MSRDVNQQSEAPRTDELLATLEARFEANMHRHPGVRWQDVRERLVAKADKLRSLGELEATAGEPDVVGRDETTGELIFVDCSPQSPGGRRSACYDRAALEARKKHPPKASAMEWAAAMGAVMLSEEQYRDLQRVEEVDTKTSSWLRTPEDVRSRGGALFGDRRYGRVFTYHNGAESYYAARGFRCVLRV